MTSIERSSEKVPGSTKRLNHASGVTQEHDRAGRNQPREHELEEGGFP